MRKLALTAVCLLVAACGSNMEQRSSSGALTGAGIGALAGGPVGALIGAAAGGAGGAVAPEGADQAFNQGLGAERHAFNQAMGQPVAGSSTAPTASQPSMAQTSTVAPAPVSRDTIKRVQAQLKRDGEYKAQVDGIFGPKTRSALRAYQSKEGLPATGALDAATLQKLTSNAPPPGTAPSAGASQQSSSNPPSAGSGTPERMTANEVRNRLESAGYSNVTDVKPAGNNGFTARADRGNATYALNIDAQSGSITSMRQISGGPSGSSGTSQTPPSNSAGGQNPPQNQAPQGQASQPQQQ